MAIRRTRSSALTKVDDVGVAEVSGVDGEEFESEVFEFHGFSSNFAGPSLTFEINNDYFNHVTFPTRGFRVAEPQSTIVYFGQNTMTVNENEIDIKLENGNGVKIENEIVTINQGDNTVVIDDKITFTVAGNTLVIDGTTITTNMDVVSNGVSLQTHTHSGVDPGAGVSGPPLP